MSESKVNPLNQLTNKLDSKEKETGKFLESLRKAIIPEVLTNEEAKIRLMKLAGIKPNKGTEK